MARNRSRRKKDKKKSVGLKDLWWAVKVSFSYAWEYRLRVIIFIILAGIGSSVNLINPYIYGKVIDRLTQLPSASDQNATIATIMYFVLIYIVVAVGSEVVYFFRTGLGSFLAIRMRQNYLVTAIGHIMHLPVSFQKSKKTGELDRMVSEASTVVFNLFGTFTRDILSDLIILPGALIIALQTNTILFLVMLLGSIAYGLVVYLTNAKMSRLRRKFVKGARKIAVQKHEIAQNILPIKQSALEGFFLNRFRTLSFEESVIKNDEIRLYSRRIILAQSIILLLAEMGVVVVSIYYIRSGEMTVGLLTMFVAYSTRAFGVFRRWVSLWEPLQEDIIELREVEDEILAQKQEVLVPEGAVRVEVSKSIVFKNVSFAHDQKAPVLKNISFEVNSGEIVAIVGESGVGKSTLVDLLPRFIIPQQGKIIIDGVSLDKIDLTHLRAQTAIVPQDIILFNESIENNLRLMSPGVKKADVMGAAQAAGVDQFVQMLPKKYRTVVGERGMKLSGGQKQRIAIARAMLRDPKLLILDEPTSALDAQTELEVTRALEKLMKGRTTIIIAHRLATVRKADKIIVLEKGRIAEMGRHEDLIKKKNGAYRKLYDLQKL